MINGEHLKAIIADSHWYRAFINMFNCQSTVHPIDEDDDNGDVNNQIEEGDDNEDVNNQIEEDDDNEDVNDPIERNDDNTSVNERGIQQHGRQTPNSLNATNECHECIPSSDAWEVTDLETNEDL